VTTDAVREALSGLVGRLGAVLGRDAEFCKAALAGACDGEHRAERAALVAAVEDGIVSRFAVPCSGPRDAMIERFSKRLLINRGVRMDLARWSVEIWAAALAPVAAREAEVRARAAKARVAKPARLRGASWLRTHRRAVALAGVLAIVAIGVLVRLAKSLCRRPP
jgi:hypothetical protein